MLTKEEEDCLEETLIWAAHRHLDVGRLELKEAVRKLCSDNREGVPQSWEHGLPGQSWLEGFFKRHPRLSERSSRIYDANRATADDETRLRTFYDGWEKYLNEMQPDADHIWNTDGTGACL